MGLAKPKIYALDFVDIQQYALIILFSVVKNGMKASPFLELGLSSLYLFGDFNVPWLPAAFALCCFGKTPFI